MNPRWLVAALLRASPALIAFVVLAWTGDLAPGPAALAAILVILALVLLTAPIYLGLARLRAAIDLMAENDAARPEVESASPAIRDLWLAITRWARASRAKAQARELEIDTAQLVLHHLPDPLLVLDERRRIARTNEAADTLLGPISSTAIWPWRCVSRRCWRRPTRCCAAKGTGSSSSISPIRSSVISRRGSCR